MTKETTAPVTTEAKSSISREMTIGDVVKKHPQAAEVFLEYGLHCVGCHVSYWETIEEGARGHGMSEEEIDMMVRDANALIENPDRQANDDYIIHLTPKAVEKIKSFLKKDEGTAYFRIGLTEGGCSGYSYVFSIDKKAKEEEDVIFNKDGLNCAVNKKWIDSLKGATVDYIETLQESGFKVHNPNASQSCGCGNSFS